MRSGSVLAKKQQSIRPYDTVTRGVCASCPAGCGVKAFMNGAAPVDFFGDEEHPLNKGSLCPKGLMVYHTHRHEKRLLVPEMRESLHAPWKRVSWEQAFDAIIGRLAELGEEPVLALPGSDHAPLDYIAGAEWFAAVRPGTYPPAAFVPAQLGSRGALAAMFGVPAGMLCMNAQRDWASSRVILVVGGDPAAEAPISFGPLEDARDRGSTLLYLGACGGMTALRSTEALQVLPGTEGVALGALLHVILRDGKEHSAFVAENTEGMAVLRSTVCKLTPAVAASVCGVEEERFERFARLLTHKSPLQVRPALSLDDAALSLCGAMVAVLGSVGLPGGGLNMPAVSPFRSDGGIAPESLEQLLDDGRCKAVIGYGDWASRLTGGKRVRKALKACSLVVHVGCFDDAARALSHVSLPVAHWSEYASLRDVSDSRAVQWSGALLAPAGDSRTPLEIWTALAAKVAPDARAPWSDVSADTGQERMAGHLLAANPLTAGITLHDLAGEGMASSGGVQWPCAKQDDVALERSRFIRAAIRGCNILFKAHTSWLDSGHRFPTANGRIRLDAVRAPQHPAVSLKERAVWLVLSGQVMHAADHPAVVLRDGLPLASIHPETAARLRLRAGDKLILRTENGTVNAVARVCWSARLDTVNMEPEFAAILLPVGETTVAVQIDKAEK
ncbi:MAG TPA: molybdopterin-dependent oxidoreductase [Candidatus Avidesulfovibrio excrementigallinarum]|nr:molybdopterin-dependent oxidoreductase [Candidatus Avidesulfovibrio excrementigallinarum]